MADSNNETSLGEIATDCIPENIPNSSDSDGKTDSTHSDNAGECGTKKRKRENKRAIQKVKKVKGEAYIGHRTIPKLKKTMKQNPCESGCPNQCNELSENDRKSIFESYWLLNHPKTKRFFT